jgi:hypothetical protein
MDGWNFETFLKRNESGSNLNTHTQKGRRRRRRKNSRKYMKEEDLLTTAGRMNKKKIFVFDRPIVVKKRSKYKRVIPPP